MVWLKVIPICFAVTAIVQAFPGTTKDYEAEIHKESLEKSRVQNGEHEGNALAILVKDIPKQIFTTIEFVHQDKEKNVKAQRGTDQEKYMYSQNTIAIDNESKTNDTENIKQSNIIQDLTEELVDAKRTNSITSQKIREHSLTQILKKHDQWLLFPKELSSIINQPRYIYDTLPVSPFPEEEPVNEGKSTHKEYNVEISKPTVLQRTSPLEVAGPMLYPQSTYSREFDLPFFD